MSNDIKGLGGERERDDNYFLAYTIILVIKYSNTALLIKLTVN